DAGELESIIQKVIDDNSKAVTDYKAGKEASLKFLVGMVMRESKGKANPQVAEELIKKLTK
ncbi:MAG: Aspartyl/glutamyl-tRNA(Asn/Gln) amidotransferase subunit B, partial [Candidatus Yanofskybacteria bacterium GW2011_GWF2_43_596]